MKIKVKCDRIISDSKLLGVFTASFDDKIAIKEIKLFNGSKGKFISWPNRSYKDSEGETKYSDNAFVYDKELREELTDKVKKAYKKALEKDDE